MGDPFPEATYEVCKNADAVLFSAVGDPKFDNDPTAKVRPEQGPLAMRKKLDCLPISVRYKLSNVCSINHRFVQELVDGADFQYYYVHKVREYRINFCLQDHLTLYPKVLH